MSDKPYNQLNELDVLIRKTVKAGMDAGTLMTIEFIAGFELFNTRPYHNYESWGQGYRVSGRGATCQREDLDDAIKGWAQEVENNASNNNVSESETTTQ